MIPSDVGNILLPSSGVAVAGDRGCAGLRDGRGDSLNYEQRCIPKGTLILLMIYMDQWLSCGVFPAHLWASLRSVSSLSVSTRQIRMLHVPYSDRYSCNWRLSTL